MLLFMLIAAPIIQIVLSVLRVANRIKIPLIIIAILALALGVALSIWTMNIIIADIPPSPTGFKCGTGAAAVLIMGIFISIVSSIVIALISYLCYSIARSKRLKNQL
jgi:hypothetical protein